MAHKLKLATWLLALTLSIRPATFHLTFPSGVENSEVVIVIEGPHFFSYDAIPILGDDQTEIEVRRPKLPSGHYKLTASLMAEGEDGLGSEYVVDSTTQDLEEP